MRNWLMVAPPIIFATLAVTFYMGMQRENPNDLPSVMVGQPAPPVALTPLSGKVPFTDAVFADGEVKLVNYWASWCAPCRVEHPNLQALADAGVPIYGINYKDAPDKALAFLDELGDPYEAIAQDDTGRVALDWGVYGVPETYVLDGDGTVLARVAGPVTVRTYEAQIKPVLEEAGVQLPF
ncbi:DsbE family thiol:disulfide interchange protein [Shimia ponticola]|uniref:DsbE family thiol:disulfide interchange protein n=1 Tax=Shimia ponticola TaxID=2582893 RepID=UPI0011BE114D|nr:DsbE family thiol:disulfide interchange protein [Shimia ponticola]